MRIEELSCLCSLQEQGSSFFSQMIHSIFFAKDTLASSGSGRPLCHICSQFLSRPDYLLEFHWFHVLHLLYPRISWRSLHSFHPFHSFGSFGSFGSFHSLQISSVHLFMSPAAKISGLLLSDHWWESGHAYFWGCLRLSAPASTCEWPTINPKNVCTVVLTLTSIHSKNPEALDVSNDFLASKSFPERAPCNKASLAWVRRSSTGAWQVSAKPKAFGPLQTSIFILWYHTLCLLHCFGLELSCNLICKMCINCPGSARVTSSLVFPLFFQETYILLSSKRSCRDHPACDAR